MSPTSTDRITLTGSQHRELTRMTRAGRTEQRLVTRAEIVLAAAAGESNAQIARRLGICEDTVRKWRRRWCAAPGAASLADAKRSGRRPKFTAVQVARVKAMACTPPRDTGLPLSRWSCPELAEQAITDGICGSISPATIRRWVFGAQGQRDIAPDVAAGPGHDGDFASRHFGHPLSRQRHKPGRRACALRHLNANLFFG